MHLKLLGKHSVTFVYSTKSESAGSNLAGKRAMAPTPRAKKLAQKSAYQCAPASWPQLRTQIGLCELAHATHAHGPLQASPHSARKWASATRPTTPHANRLPRAPNSAEKLAGANPSQIQRANLALQAGPDSARKWALQASPNLAGK